MARIWARTLMRCTRLLPKLSESCGPDQLLVRSEAHSRLHGFMRSECRNRLDRFHWNRKQIIDQPNFFLQKGLGVCHAAQHAIEACHGFDARTNLCRCRKYVTPGL